MENKEWGLIIPVDPTYVPTPSAQLQALQLWASRDKQGCSKTLEVHHAVQYFPPADGALRSVCCPNCRRPVEEEWLQEAITQARMSDFTNLLTVIPCCDAFISLNDLKVVKGFSPFGFARFCMSTLNPDPLSVGSITLKHLESIIGCQLRVVWQQRRTN